MASDILALDEYLGKAGKKNDEEAIKQIISKQKLKKKDRRDSNTSLSSFTSRIELTSASRNRGDSFATLSSTTSRFLHSPLDSFWLSHDSSKFIFRQSRASRNKRLHKLELNQLLGIERPIERFRRVAKGVRVIIGICLSLKSYVRYIEKNLWSFVEMQLDFEDSMRNFLIFDRTQYSFRKSTKASLKLKTLSQKLPSDRSEDDLALILALLYKNQAIQKYPISLQKELCKVMFYQCYEKRRTVIKQGHIASAYYIVISGVCIVNVKEDHPKTGISYSRTVNELKEGDSFGEISLMNNCLRPFTVLCKEEAELLVILEEDFKRLIKDPLDHQRNEHISYCKTLRLFKEVPLENLKDEHHSLIYKYFKKNSVIVKNSAQNLFLIVIKSGKCKIVAELKEMKKQRPKSAIVDRTESGLSYLRKRCNSAAHGMPPAPEGRLTTHCSISDELRQKLEWSIGKDALTEKSGFLEKHQKLKLIEEKGETKEKSISLTLASTNFSQRQKNKSMPPKKLKTTYVQIAVLEPGSVFGLESLFTESPRTDLSLISEGAECIFISKRRFLREASSGVLDLASKMVTSFPLPKTILQKIGREREWTEYKQSLVKEIFEKYPHI